MAPVTVDINDWLPRVIDAAIRTVVSMNVKRCFYLLLSVPVLVVGCAQRQAANVTGGMRARYELVNKDEEPKVKPD